MITQSNKNSVIQVRIASLPSDFAFYLRPRQEDIMAGWGYDHKDKLTTVKIKKIVFKYFECLCRRLNSCRNVATFKNLKHIEEFKTGNY